MRYGKIFTAYWTSPDIADLSIEAKAIGAYLLTSSHSNMVGCYRLPIAYAVDDLKMGSETLSKAFQDLSERGFIAYDSTLSWVLIRKYLKWNPIENPNQGKAAVRLVNEVPRNSNVYAAFIQILKKNPANFPDGFMNGLETPSEPFPNPSEGVSKPVTVTVAVTAAETVKTISSPSALFESDNSHVSEPAPDDRKQETEIVKRLFLFYCERVGRNPRQYTLTDERRRKALARLRERAKIHGNFGAAEADLAQAIENLSASDFHREKGFLEWDKHLFRSTEQLQQRLESKQPQKGNSTNGNYTSPAAQQSDTSFEFLQ